jgi:hypothetical protein
MPLFDTKSGISGIDQLILQAEIAEGEFDAAAMEALEALTSLKNDLVDGGQSWGAAYLRQQRKRAVAAIRAFAGDEDLDLKQALAYQRVIGDYLRVATFAAETLDAGVELTADLVGDFAEGGEAGDIDGGQDTEIAEEQPSAERPRRSARNHKRSRRG